ncbi:uncharacterized protein LOC136038163 [Artemia franciscana]|uniref:uncharacterized protein LOC136038163 n=1 Tax=Artemia franciscana TaxID=6661 RepID=UPI0032DBEAA5
MQESRVKLSDKGKGKKLNLPVLKTLNGLKRAQREPESDDDLQEVYCTTSKGFVHVQGFKGRENLPQQKGEASPGPSKGFASPIQVQGIKAIEVLHKNLQQKRSEASPVPRPSKDFVSPIQVQGLKVTEALHLPQQRSEASPRASKGNANPNVLVQGGKGADDSGGSSEQTRNKALPEREPPVKKTKKEPVKGQSSADAFIEEAAKAPRSIVETPMNQNQSPNFGYCQSLAAQLDSFTPLVQARIKAKFASIVLEEMEKLEKH